MVILLELAAIFIGYLLGSIPSAYIVTKLRKGVDIRKIGIGNMGAGNVIREVGLVEGGVVAVVDIAKGAGAVLIAQALGVSQFGVLGAGLAAILGHNFPVYIGFKGGQGVCTVIGIFCVLAPWSTLIVLVPVGALMLTTHQIFASTLVLGPFLPLVIWFVEGDALLTFFALAIVLILVFRNWNRLKEARQLISRSSNRG